MLKVYFYITLIVFFFLAILGFGFIKSVIQETLTDKVVKTERIQDCSGSSCTSKYLVFGEKEVYENVDTIWFMKFNSSDFYRDIQAGKTYQFTVAGWRVPFLSWYRNIVRYQELKGGEK